MISKGFRFNVLVRAILLALSAFLAGLEIFGNDNYFSGLVILAVSLYLGYNLVEYVQLTNRKLNQFLESVRYSDFTTNFSAEELKDPSFSELYHSFNEVMEAFRRTRAEKEEHLLYLNTVVQQVQVGLLAYDAEGNIELINNVARRLLDVVNLKNIKQLQYANPDMYRLLRELPSGGKHLLLQSNEIQLSINATELVLHNRRFKLLSLQNIKSELQEKEIEAWQNLTRVLRHEIMNSITPIASLVSTLSEILEEDVIQKNGHYLLEEESILDIREGLATIHNRSEGLQQFVDAYRNFTSIPTPKMERLRLKDLFSQISTLQQAVLREAGISYSCSVQPETLEVNADPQLLEMVLINLIKNAMEALDGRVNAEISIVAEPDEHQRATIKVHDNGPGIEPDVLHKIFIPFFTTKGSGTGIGLALSRQIVQMHGGQMLVESTPSTGTTFTIRFS